MSEAPTIVMFRFDEPDIQIPPSDAQGSLVDALPVSSGTPTIVDGYTGKARRFANLSGLIAAQSLPGSALASRDVSIQCLARWDIVAQNAYGQPGTILSSGTGAVAGDTSYGAELRVLNASLRIGELRSFWTNVAGTTITPAGGHFEVPPSGYVLLTCTRKWLSPTQVVVKHYVGSRLIGEAVSSSGDIGGSATATATIGNRFVTGAPARYLHGDIDELRVVNVELTPEEIEATHLRLTRDQPAGYQTIRDLLPPGFPITSDTDSRVQRFLRVLGNGLGFASAQDSNHRRNFFPSRAYGPLLSEWERITGVNAAPFSTLETRRQKLASTLRKSNGSSPPSVETAVAGVLGVAPSQLEILASSNRVDDNFATIDTRRWKIDGSGWTAAGTARCNLSAGDYQFDAGLRNWRTLLTTMLADGKDHIASVKITPTTFPDGAEAGIVYGDFANGNITTIGLRKLGSYVIAVEKWKRFKTTGEVQVDIVSNAPTWLQLKAWPSNNTNYGALPILGKGERHYIGRWSQVGPQGPYQEDNRVGSDVMNWAGLYVRSVNGGPIASSLQADFDDWAQLNGAGQRSNRWYVYRDPAIPGSYDAAAANQIIRNLRQSQTTANVCFAKTALCDNANSRLDETPMGGL
jgi:hypothetical protein